jgi:phosphotriesterase-related protein
MTRRELIAEVGALVIAGTPRQTVRPPSPRLVPTVTGPLGAQHLGLTLMHEHLLVDFIGADQVSPSRYDANQAFSVILPHLAKARAAGCETLVDCTPAYLGRDVRLLMRLSGASGVNILTNTGYYGAAKDKHLPRHAFTESADQLSARWIREFERGIDGTDVKPAFVSAGMNFVKSVSKERNWPPPGSPT